MVSREVERRLSAVLAADVVGYSRMMVADEAGTLGEVKARHDDLVTPQITKHGGRIVKAMAAGFLAEFRSAVAAVQCAVAIQRAMAERNAVAARERRMDYRIGVNFGDVIIDGDDIFGDQVNITARLVGLAEPGGICLSGDAHRAARKKLDLDYEDLGEHRAKNIDRPIQVWRVRLDGAGRTADARSGDMQ